MRIPMPHQLLPTAALLGAAVLASAQQPETSVTVTEAGEPILIAYGEHTTGGRINTAVDLDRFEFCGEIGDDIRILVQATFDNMDPVVELYGPAGGPAEKTASCANGCSLSLSHVLTASGRHTILISDSGNNEGGRYTMQIERLFPHLNPPSLLYNVPLVDSIDRGSDFDFFVFAAELNAKVRLNVTATFDNMDPVVIIYRPDGSPVHTLSCPNGCSRSHTWDVDMAGMHHLLVYDSGLNEGGKYQLGLQQLIGSAPTYAGSAWTNLSEALPGSEGRPVLFGGGTMLPNTPVTIDLCKAPPSASAVLVAGATRVDLPLFGGTLVPSPDAALPFAVDQNGKLNIVCGNWPTAPTGLTLYMQVWVLDSGAVQNIAASNAMVGITP